MIPACDESVRHRSAPHRQRFRRARACPNPTIASHAPRRTRIAGFGSWRSCADGCASDGIAARTEEAYVHWIRRYIVFNDRRHPRDLGEEDVRRFLSTLAVDAACRRVDPEPGAGGADLFVRRGARPAVGPHRRHRAGAPPCASAGRAQRTRSPSAPRPARGPVSSLRAADVRGRPSSDGMHAASHQGRRRRAPGNRCAVRKGQQGPRVPLAERVLPDLRRHLRRRGKRNFGATRSAVFATTGIPDASCAEISERRARVVAGSTCFAARASSSTRLGYADVITCTNHSSSGLSRGREGGAHRQARDVSHASPFVCDASPGVRRGHSDGAGASWAYRSSDDDDLHACPESGRVGSPESGGRAVRGLVRGHEGGGRRREGGSSTAALPASLRRFRLHWARYTARRCRITTTRLFSLLTSRCRAATSSQVIGMRADYTAGVCRHSAGLAHKYAVELALNSIRLRRIGDVRRQASEPVLIAGAIRRLILSSLFLRGSDDRPSPAHDRGPPTPRVCGPHRRGVRQRRRSAGPVSSHAPDRLSEEQLRAYLLHLTTDAGSPARASRSPCAGSGSSMSRRSSVAGRSSTPPGRSTRGNSRWCSAATRSGACSPPYGRPRIGSA